jgi:cytochrome c-type biogenesis protein CcmH/NrfG
MDSEAEQLVAALEERTTAKPTDPVAWYALGLAYVVADSNSKRAVEALVRAVVVDPEFTEAWYALGLTLAENQVHARASKCLTQVIRLEANHALAHYNRAISRAFLGQFADAIADVQIAVELQPSLKAKAATDEELARLRLFPDFSSVIK